MNSVFLANLDPISDVVHSYNSSAILYTQHSLYFRSFQQVSDNLEKLITTDPWSAQPDECVNYKWCDAGVVKSGSCPEDQRFDIELRQCVSALDVDYCDIDECACTGEAFLFSFFKKGCSWRVVNMYLFVHNFERSQSFCFLQTRRKTIMRLSV